MNILNCLGIGTVVSVKETNSKEIFVDVPMLNPLGDGELKTNVEEDTQVTSDGNNGTVKSIVLKSNAYPAMWLPYNPNRLTAPDVRNGSQVAIYRFGDQDRRYWTTHGLNETFRLETIIYGISANPNTDENIEVNLDNFYIFEMSSHNKRLKLTTSQMNGEVCRMEVLLDLGNGQFSYKDTELNVLGVDVMNHVIYMLNQEESYLELNRKNFNVTVKNDINYIATNDINLKAKNITLDASGNILLKAKGTITNSSEGAFTVNASDATISCNTTINGDLTVNGGLTATGKASVGSLNIGGKEYGEHHHYYDGNSTTSGPI